MKLVTLGFALALPIFALDLTDCLPRVEVKRQLDLDHEKIATDCLPVNDGDGDYYDAVVCNWMRSNPKKYRKFQAREDAKVYAQNDRNCAALSPEERIRRLKLAK